MKPKGLLCGIATGLVLLAAAGGAKAAGQLYYIAPKQLVDEPRAVLGM